MSRYRLSPEASNDLDDLSDALSQAAAARVIDALEKRCQILAQFPGLGTPCEDLATGLRRSPVGKYVIFFRASDDGIEVVRILHGARNISPSFFP